MNEEIKKLKKIAKKRYISHNKEFPLEVYEKLLLENYAMGFLCSYCGKKLTFSQPYPSKDIPSIDHKVPRSRGGIQDEKNLVVCCFECNIIKGTLNFNTYIKLLNYISQDKELCVELFNEWFLARIANKIERVKKENDTKTT